MPFSMHAASVSSALRTPSAQCLPRSHCIRAPLRHPAMATPARPEMAQASSMPAGERSVAEDARRRYERRLVAPETLLSIQDII